MFEFRPARARQPRRGVDYTTASFVKELVRRAVLRGALDEPTLRAALAGLLDERQALARSILGG